MPYQYQLNPINIKLKCLDFLSAKDTYAVNNCQLLSGAVQFLSQRLAFDFWGPSFVVTTRDGLEVKCWDLDDLCWKTTEERTHEGVRGLREGMYIMHCG